MKYILFFLLLSASATAQQDTIYEGGKECECDVIEILDYAAEKCRVVLPPYTVFKSKEQLFCLSIKNTASLGSLSQVSSKNYPSGSNVNEPFRTFWYTRPEMTTTIIWYLRKKKPRA